MVHKHSIGWLYLICKIPFGITYTIGGAILNKVNDGEL